MVEPILLTMSKLTFILFFFAFGHTKAQTYNNGYLLDKPAAVFRGLHLVNDTLIVHGYVAEPFAFNPVKYMIAKIDLDGTPLLGYSAMLDSFTDYFTTSRFVVTKDSSYAFVGIKDMFQGGLFFKTKRNGTNDFAKQYIDSTAGGYGFTGIIELPDSCFIIMGRHTTINDIVSSILIKTDPLGNTVWRRKFSYLSEIPSGITLLQNGYILLSSSCSSNNFNGSSSNINTLFRTVDTAGNLLSTWIDTTKRTFGANAYHQLNDGGGIYISQWINSIYNSGGNPPTYLSMRCGYIVREDSLHNKIWELKLGQSSAIPNLFQLKKLSDGNYLAVGGTYDSTYTDGQPYKNTGWLIKFDENGTVLWQKKYFNTTDMPGQTNYLYDFVELSDGSIIAAGERIDGFTDYPQQGWLLRLDNYGCLVPGCQNVGINESENRLFNLKIYPNPVSDVLYTYFDFPQSQDASYSIKISSIDGREMQSIYRLQKESTYMIETGNYASGIYIIGVYKEQQLVRTSKFIKQ